MSDFAALGGAGPAINWAAPIYFFGFQDSNAISDDRFALPYIWYMNTISRTLALLKPADLFPAWK